MSLPIEWEGITVCVSQSPNWLESGYDHIEVRAEKPIPITETGYRSCFLPPEELALFDSVEEEFVRQWMDKETTPEYWARLEQSKQGELF